MRIITGSARGVRLMTLEGEATRPTTEKVKEAVFSSLQFELEGRRVLDLFAGSGQMGLEAMSRGAASAMFIDSSPEAMKIIKANAEKTRFFDRSRFLISDYRNYIRKAAGRDRYDLVFLDPPYASLAVGDALARLASADLIAEGGIAVCEGENDIFELHPELAALYEGRKAARYGRVFINILTRKSHDA